MAHRKLFPKPGNPYLSPSEIIARLQANFRYVEVDKCRGEAHVDKMVTQLQRMRFLTPPPATPEVIERLQSVRGEAVEVIFYDDAGSDDAYLTTTAIPDEPLFSAFRPLFTKKPLPNCWSVVRRSWATKSQTVDIEPP